MKKLLKAILYTFITLACLTAFALILTLPRIIFGDHIVPYMLSLFVIGIFIGIYKEL